MGRRVTSYLGIDYRTVGNYKWIWHYNERKKVERTEDEKQGFIPVVACHGGKLSTNIYYRARQLGWGMFLNWEEKDGTIWRALYWHIEKPWRRLGTYWRRVGDIFRDQYVKEGSVIAIAGNTGYPRSSTGPHLHFELQKQVDGKWISVDPLPYLKGECKRI